MTKAGWTARVGACALGLMLLASCGGGGGGSDGGPGSGGSGSWLTFSPAQVEVIALPGASTLFGVIATATRTFSRPINLMVVDTRGVITADIKIETLASTQYSASMGTNPGLAPGLYTGNFELRLCYDDPRTCAQPVEGSPWQLPYRITVQAASSLTFSGWEQASTTPGFIDNFGLASRKGTPFVVAAGFYSKVMETWTSADVGTTWTDTAITGPTPLTRGFALATDDTSIHLSGGEELSTLTTTVPAGQYRNHVWKFDGSTWTQKTAAAAFPARSQHQMVNVGGTLYVMGGRNATSLLYDMWTSGDDGTTWTKVTDSLPTEVGYPTCALNWGGTLLVIGQRAATSTDGGASWTVRAPFPISTGLRISNCAVFNGRVVVTENYSTYYAYSSADLATWQREPQPILSSPAPGMAVAGGRLMMTSGSGTSQRITYRTVP